MAATPLTMVRWNVAAFTAANPAEVVVVHGASSRLTRARTSAASAALAVLFEMDDAGLLFLSITVGFVDAMTGIDPDMLYLEEYKTIIDGLVSLDRRMHSRQFKK